MCNAGWGGPQASDCRCCCCRAPAVRQRWEIYVCTAAEREYALEAWRLLDPHARLIPWKQRAERIVCVPAGRKKALTGVLGLGGPPLRPPGLPCSAMPLAVIVDDRLDVRTPRVRKGVQGLVTGIQEVCVDRAQERAGRQAGLRRAAAAPARPAPLRHVADHHSCCLPGCARSPLAEQCIGEQGGKGAGTRKYFSTGFGYCLSS